jgi:hypothetical protein
VDMKVLSDLPQQVIAEAAAALLEWLNEGWVAAPVEWNLDRSRIDVQRDWYSPCWIVTFTIDEPPWFGDSICVEVQEMGNNRFDARIDDPTFAEEHIICHHCAGDLPAEHWVRNF